MSSVFYPFLYVTIAMLTIAGAFVISILYLDITKKVIPVILVLAIIYSACYLLKDKNTNIDNSPLHKHEIQQPDSLVDNYGIPA